MEDVAQAAQKIGDFLQVFTESGRFRLRYRIKLRGGKFSSSENPGPETAEAGEDETRTLYVEFSGPDASLLTARNGELLDALQHLATKILRIEPIATVVCAKPQPQQWSMFAPRAVRIRSRR